MQNRTAIAISIIVAVAILNLFLNPNLGVLVNSILIGSEENVDFIAGTNITITGSTSTADTITITINSSATGTATSTGDITDVGPGCSAGPCLTNAATTTGGTLLVWEGTTDDDFDITFTITSDPATSSVFNFAAVADHEWSPITGDFTIGDSDEGQIQLGSLTIGKANDIVSTTVTDGIAFFYNDATSLAEDISFIFLGPAGIPRFVLAVEGPDLATYNPRSLLIGPAANFANVDENVICSTNFSNIDCDTGGSGADLGVQDDVEIGGDLFLSTSSRIVFGPAESLEIPQCGITNQDGEICSREIATSTLFVWFQGEQHALSATSSKGLLLFAATSTDDFALWRTDDHIVLTKACFLAEGGTNVILSLQEFDSDGNSPSSLMSGDLTAAAGTTGCTGEGGEPTMNENTIEGANWIGTVITSVSGTNTRLHITWYFKWIL